MRITLHPVCACVAALLCLALSAGGGDGGGGGAPANYPPVAHPPLEPDVKERAHDAEHRRGGDGGGAPANTRYTIAKPTFARP